jgi:hypothetical protein
MTSEELKANKPFFDAAETALDNVRLLREIDHARWLIPAAQDGLKPHGIDVKVDDYGLDDDGRPARTLNLERTFAENLDVDDVRTNVQDWLAAHYDADPGANDHRIVMESMSVAANVARGVSCSTE